MKCKLKVKFRRLNLGLTQKQLKKKIEAEYSEGISLGTIVSIEKGNIDGVKVATLKKIARALDTTVQELFFSDEE